MSRTTPAHYHPKDAKRTKARQFKQDLKRRTARGDYPLPRTMDIQLPRKEIKS